MTDPLNRDEILALLEQLGAEDDAEALAAARALHARIAETDTGWDELLVSEDDGADTAEGAPETPVAAELPAGGKGRDKEALRLIEKLLARSGVTEDFRRELEGYKSDIADGTFADDDLRYLVAVDKRLSAMR